MKRESTETHTSAWGKPNHEIPANLQRKRQRKWGFIQLPYLPNDFIKTRPNQRQLEPTDSGTFSIQFFHVEVQRVRQGWLLRQLQGMSQKEDMEERAYFQWRSWQVGAGERTLGADEYFFQHQEDNKTPLNNLETSKKSRSQEIQHWH